MNGVMTQASLDAQRVTYSALFTKGLKSALLVGAQLATPVPSTSGSNKYGWFGRFPKLRKWMGERRYQAVAEKVYHLANDKFTGEVEIDEDDWSDDNLGSYNALIESWGKSAGELPDDLIFAALRDGHLRECYDGQNFFDTDHPYDYRDGDGKLVESIYSNMSSGAGTVDPWFLVDLTQPLKPILLQNRQAPTFWMGTNRDVIEMNNGKVPLHGKARGAGGYTMPQLAHRSTNTLNRANYEAAKAAMTGLKDEQGEPLAIRPTHIVVGNSNEAAAKALFETQLVNGGDSNTLYNDVKIIVAPKLA